MDTGMDVEMKDDNREEEVREKLRAIIDVSSPEFSTHVRQLADSVGLEGVEHPDPVVLLQAIVIYVRQALERDQTDTNTNSRPKSSLNQIPLGMKSSGDANVDNAVRILRTFECGTVTTSPNTDQHFDG
ncbi:Adenylate kinase isoenzyme 6-like protein [Aphelenchoides bicaudatus]|nr:Adenylate kinase isoenzyme 6-like protein [Aphelenchoides bicaudatus]